MRNKKIDKNTMKNDNPDVFKPPNKIINKYYEYDRRFTRAVDPNVHTQVAKATWLK